MLVLKPILWKTACDSLAQTCEQHKYTDKNEKHLKNEQRSRDAAAKKRANTSGVGKINNYCEDIYIHVPPYNTTH